jgi:hypothetical protein
MKQQTLTGFERHMKTTRRAQFLADMARIVPWAEVAAVIEPVYPKVSELGGRPPIELGKMLRIYFLQLWFNLSDPAAEEALYDSVSMRAFVPLPSRTDHDLQVPLLEKHKLGKPLLTAVNQYLHENGVKISRGTIVDATIISAPSSTKNKDGKRARCVRRPASVLRDEGARRIDSKEKDPHARLGGERADRDALPICCTAAKHACGETRVTRVAARDPRPRAEREGLHESVETGSRKSRR